MAPRKGGWGGEGGGRITRVINRAEKAIRLVLRNLQCAVDDLQGGPDPNSHLAINTADKVWTVVCDALKQRPQEVRDVHPGLMDGGALLDT